MRDPGRRLGQLGRANALSRSCSTIHAARDPARSEPPPRALRSHARRRPTWRAPARSATPAVTPWSVHPVADLLLAVRARHRPAVDDDRSLRALDAVGRVATNFAERDRVSARAPPTTRACSRSFCRNASVGTQRRRRRVVDLVGETGGERAEGDERLTLASGRVDAAHRLVDARDHVLGERRPLRRRARRAARRARPGTNLRSRRAPDAGSRRRHRLAPRSAARRPTGPASTSWPRPWSGWRCGGYSSICPSSRIHSRSAVPTLVEQLVVRLEETSLTGLDQFGALRLRERRSVSTASRKIFGKLIRSPGTGARC